MATSTQQALRGITTTLDGKPSEWTRAGHTFLGWSTNKAALTADYSDEATVEGGFNDNITLYAIWTAQTFNVTLNNADGDPENNVPNTTASTSATYGSPMSSVTPPTRTGYIFAGYFDGTNGTGKKYYNADGTSASTWDKTSPTTLYASWVEDYVEITFDSNDSND